MMAGTTLQKSDEGKLETGPHLGAVYFLISACKSFERQLGSLTRDLWRVLHGQVDARLA